MSTEEKIYQDIKDNNLFTIDPFKPFRAKGFYNPTTGHATMQPWFQYEHEDNMIGFHHYNKFGDESHMFIACEEFGGKTYILDLKT